MKTHPSLTFLKNPLIQLVENQFLADDNPILRLQQPHLGQLHQFAGALVVDLEFVRVWVVGVQNIKEGADEKSLEVLEASNVLHKGRKAADRPEFLNAQQLHGVPGDDLTQRQSIAGEALADGGLEDVVADLLVGEERGQVAAGHLRRHASQPQHVADAVVAVRELRVVDGEELAAELEHQLGAVRLLGERAAQVVAQDALLVLDFAQHQAVDCRLHPLRQRGRFRGHFSPPAKRRVGSEMRKNVGLRELALGGCDLDSNMGEMECGWNGM